MHQGSTHYMHVYILVKYANSGQIKLQYNALISVSYILGNCIYVINTIGVRVGRGIKHVLFMKLFE